jgi:hypothetical protein
MKVAKVIVAIVLGIIAISLAWKVLTGLFAVIYGLLTGLLGLAIGVVIIGGLGWVILRLLGKKSLTGGKYESLP